MQPTRRMPYAETDKRTLKIKALTVPKVGDAIKSASASRGEALSMFRQMIYNIVYHKRGEPGVIAAAIIAAREENEEAQGILNEVIMESIVAAISLVRRGVLPGIPTVVESMLQERSSRTERLVQLIGDKTATLPDDDAVSEAIAAPVWEIMSRLNFAFFPRCEYHTRYLGSTYFSMDAPQYWGTYFRSTVNGGGCDRYESLGLGKTFVDLDMYKEGKQPAKTGNFQSPFAHKEYAEAYLVTAGTPSGLPLALGYDHIGELLMYDALLAYKNTICRLVIEALPPVLSNIQAWHENEYPCVMVQVKCPIDYYGGAEGVSGAWHSLAMSYYVAIANKVACGMKIPVEIVIRSSFGHNIPSVSETTNTFRINVGLVPTKYASVLARSIICLDERIGKIGDIKLGDKIVQQQNTGIDLYNPAKKDRKETKAEKKEKGVRAYKTLEHWQEGLLLTLGVQGNSENGLVIHELTRFNSRMDLLIDSVLEDEVATTEPNAAADSERWSNMLGRFTYFKRIGSRDVPRVGLRAPVNDHKYVSQKQSFPLEEECKSIKEDKEFWALITRVRDALKTPSLEFHIASKQLGGIHSSLEEANLQFMMRRSGAGVESATKTTDSLEEDIEDVGSDSDAEVDKRFFSRKLTVVTGMKAINLAVTLARYYCSTHLQAGCEFTTDFMYYETGKAIKLLSDNFAIFTDTTSGAKRYSIPCIDLTHCKSKDQSKDQAKKISLASALTSALTSAIRAPVVILDYTSASTSLISESADKFLSSNTVLLLISSGLKNEQAGADTNPYGTVRILAKEHHTVLNLYKIGCATIKAPRTIKHTSKARGEHTHTLSETNACLPTVAHQIRKAYKRAGFTVTSRSIFGEDRVYTPDPALDSDTPPAGFDEFLSSLSYVGMLNRMLDYGMSLGDISYIFKHNRMLFEVIGDASFITVFSKIEDAFDTIKFRTLTAANMDTLRITVAELNDLEESEESLNQQRERFVDLQNSLEGVVLEEEAMGTLTKQALRASIRKIAKNLQPIDTRLFRRVKELEDECKQAGSVSVFYTDYVEEIVLELQSYTNERIQELDAEIEEQHYEMAYTPLIETIKESLGMKEPLPGLGTSAHTKETPIAFWREYYVEGFRKLLTLRMLDTGTVLTDRVPIINSGVKIVVGVSQAVTSVADGAKVIMPILYDVSTKYAHWVGFLITKFYGVGQSVKYQVVYIDPENNPVPEVIKGMFSDVPSHTIAFEQKFVKPQSYNNCGPELIEHFAQIITGHRVPEELVPIFHSWLLERSLYQEAGYMVRELSLITDRNVPGQETEFIGALGVIDPEEPYDVPDCTTSTLWQIQSGLYQANLALKVADTMIDVIRWHQHPTPGHAKALMVDALHLNAMLSGYSVVSVATSAALVAHTYNEAGFNAAIKQAGIAAAYMALPVLAFSISPAVGVGFTAAMTCYTAYQVASNGDLLYQENFGSDPIQEHFSIVGDMAGEWTI